MTLQINKWEALRALHSKRLTQGGAAIQLGISESTLSNLLNSTDVRCAAITAAKLCKLLDLTFENLFSLASSTESKGC